MHITISESLNSMHLTKKLLLLFKSYVESLMENLTCQIQPGNIEDEHGRDDIQSPQESGLVEENVCF